MIVGQSPEKNIVIIRVILVYALFSLMWIFFGDFLLFFYIPPSLSFVVSIVKGTLFVVLSSTLIYILMNYAFTELELVEEELEVSQHELQEIDTKFEFMINQLPVIFWELDSKGIIVRIFGKNLAYLSNNASEIEGKSIFELYANSPKVMEKAKQVLDGQPSQWQLTVNERHYENYYQPLIKHNEVIGALGLGVDITDTTTMKKELKATQRSLQAIHRLDLLGTMLGKVTHDMNNYFTLISGYMELLKEDTSESSIDKYFPKLSKSINQAEDLLDNLLSYSKAPQENTIITIQQLLDDLQPLLDYISTETVKLEYMIDDDLLDHKIPKFKLEAIITNLLSNAVDSLEGERGFVSLNISIDMINTQERRSDKYLLLEVSDTGKGIPSTILPYIFDPLFSTKPQQAGTGLGLSIVADMTKSMGGFVDIKSDDKGTTMRVYLPVTDLISTKDHIKEEIDYLLPTKKFTALILDDNPEIIDYVTTIIEPYVETLYTFTDAFEAINQLKSIPGNIDVFIADIVIPDFDGIAFSKRVMTDHQNTSFIFISGYKGMEIVSRKIKGSRFLAKPFNPEELLHYITISLEKW